MNITKKLSFSFAVVLCITLIVGGAGWFQIRDMEQSYRELFANRVDKIVQIQDLKSNALTQTKNFRAYLLTGEISQYEEYEKNRVAFANRLKDFEARLTPVEAEQMTERFVAMEQEYADVVQEIKAYKMVEDREAYTRLVMEKCVPMAQALSDTADELAAYQQKLLDQSRDELTAKVEQIESFILITVLLAVAAGAVLSIWTTRLIARPVTMVAAAARQIAAGDLTGADLQIKQRDEIGDMSRDFNIMKQQLQSLLKAVAMNANQLSRASSELSTLSAHSTGGAEQMSEAVRNINESASFQVERNRENQQAVRHSAERIRVIAESSAVTAELSEQAISQAKRGEQQLEHTVEQMALINSSIEQSAGLIFELGEQSQSIVKITQLIQDVARQTKILSLNASIEAARAGVQGKGFAVVAEEVQQLSDKTQKASGEIAERIHDMVHTVSEAVQAMRAGSQEMDTGSRMIRDTAGVFHEVQQAVLTVAEHSQEVSAATEELSGLTEQLLESERKLVGLSMGISGQSQGVADTCQEQLASIEQISASAEGLQQMADQLLREMNQFRLEATQEVGDQMVSAPVRKEDYEEEQPAF
ncbi:methyl-accepting chemotaxis protein [Paenibacillus massiliensis]|uniref:methyl-accepting chemotaxis protein n=1 Tax=Paenibacillus massiliensis TaxID=225917 RepID=UPI00037B1109|nr:methyl-accepting chemotaxis protein [Paenibacillus massiliensis]